MDSFRLFLELNKVRSGMWHMPWPSPTAEDGRGDIDLRPANVTYGADQAGWIVKTTHRLVVLGASPTGRYFCAGFVGWNDGDDIRPGGPREKGVGFHEV